MSIAILTTYGASIFLARIRSGPSYNLSAINFDIGTVGIFTATDTRTPPRAIGKDIATIDGERSAID